MQREGLTALIPFWEALKRKRRIHYANFYFSIISLFKASFEHSTIKKQLLRSRLCVAEREGFEPPVPRRVQLISSQPRSTTPASLLEHTKIKHLTYRIYNRKPGIRVRASTALEIGLLFFDNSFYSDEGELVVNFV